MKRYTALFLMLIVTTFFILPNILNSKESDEDIKKKLPKMLGANNAGKEFWFTIPPVFEDESGGYANFVKIFVTSPAKTYVTVEVPGRGKRMNNYTVPNDVIEFNITPADAQPYLKSGYQPCVPEDIYKGVGIHITADEPLVVYVVCRYRYTSDGFLAIPVSSLGREYICASYGDMTAMFPMYTLPSLCGITAAYDNTKVRFKLGGNTLTQTAGGMKPGDVKEATLNKGDVWMFSSKGPEADLTGSKITSNYPIAVVSGNQCTNIPTSNQWCDYTVEMDIPTYTWGYDYHVPKVPKRRYPSLVRIFAKEPNTNYYRDGKQIGQLAEAGGVLGRAYIEMRMVSMGSDPRSVVFSGDKPIGVTLYNCGVQEDVVTSNSDPFVMAMTPMEQYQKTITFCTPGVSGSGFAENYLNLVFQTDENDLIPDDLEFADVKEGDFSWSKVKSKFGGTFEKFVYDANNKKFGVKTLELPAEGVFRIQAKTPFAAYSFGYSSYDSYGYPTSAAFIDVVKKDTLPPVPTWVMDCDGYVHGEKGGPATIKDYPEEDSVRSNLSMIVFHAGLSYNYKIGRASCRERV